jgi:hypothetical protein
LLQPDQLDGGAVIGRMRPAALVPALRQIAGFARFLPGQLHAAFIGRRLGRRVARDRWRLGGRRRRTRKDE